MNLLETKPAPPSPGVYLFKDKDSQVIYIGKAKVLRNRVRSYFAVNQSDSKTRHLVRNIADVEYMLTDNELEALILESILIKKHKPKYNIRLRDDKNYQFIKVDYSLPIPQVYSVRKKEENLLRSGRAKYFGPYTSGLNVRNTIRLVKRIFPYCQSKDVGGRPCFNYHLHRCPGLCVGNITKEEYSEGFKNIEQFLQGKTDKLRRDLQVSMEEASQTHHFEKAAALRDQIRALNSLSEQQKVITMKQVNQDFISLYKEKSRAAINLFLVRDGKLTGRENMVMENVESESDGEILSAFIERYYLEATNLPKEIYVQCPIPELELHSAFLEQKMTEVTGREQKVRIKEPKRGASKELIGMGIENAKNFLGQLTASFEKEDLLIEKGLRELQSVAGLQQPPGRIECFDISNIQGKDAVGSMVVFKDGKPQKDQYRKFKIRTKSTPDDYSMMSEMLRRRINNEWPAPDLWVVDGGKGQLGVALKVLEKHNISIPVVSIAKDREEIGDDQKEKIYLPGTSEPVVLGSGNPALTIIQRLRDEAHRFAITYHRKVRSKSMFE